jgi:hypothetical protein
MVSSSDGKPHGGGDVLHPFGFVGAAMDVLAGRLGTVSSQGGARILELYVWYCHACHLKDVVEVLFPVLGFRMKIHVPLDLVSAMLCAGGAVMELIKIKMGNT